MTNALQKRVQGQAYRLVYRQLGGVAILALAATLFYSYWTGLSVLAGGLAYGLPNLLFVWRVFRYSGAQEMTRFVVAFFFGEMLKLVLSGILIIFIVKYLPVSLSSVLVGFVGAIISFWIACFMQFSKQDNSMNKGVVG
jgi:ATP synthase protein I